MFAEKIMHFFYNCILLISTMFGVGKISSKYQGTIGSFVSVLILYLLSRYDIYYNFFVFVLTFILSFISVSLYLKKLYPPQNDTNNKMDLLAMLKKQLESKTKALESGGAKASNKIDPQEIVIDEFLGQIIAFVPLSVGADLFANLFNNCTCYGLLLNAILSFLLFRFFDAVKPFPVNHIDESSNGTFSIIFDDIAAGILALITKNAIYIILAKFFI